MIKTRILFVVVSCISVIGVFVFDVCFVLPGVEITGVAPITLDAGVAGVARVARVAGAEVVVVSLVPSVSSFSSFLLDKLLNPGKSNASVTCAAPPISFCKDVFSFFMDILI
jgi:hypothetical protein